MSNSKYATIRNNDITNIIVFDNPSNDLLDFFKQEDNLDSIILATEKTVIGGTYDGQFWSPQPYPSWTKNQQLNEWEAPTPYPVIEEGSNEKYEWDENTMSWLLIPPSE
jgi:hypothetical protein